MKETSRLLEFETRFDKAFVTDAGNEELCHFTGWLVQFEGDPMYYGEYEDSLGNLHYC